MAARERTQAQPEPVRTVSAPVAAASPAPRRRPLARTTPEPVAQPEPVAAAEPTPAPEAVTQPVAVAETPKAVPASPAAQPEAEPLAAVEPEMEEAAEEAPVAQAEPAPPVRLAADTRPSRPTTYRVSRGDNLTQIARQYGVSVRDLMGWNDLGSETIRPGQRLRLTAPAGYNPRTARARTVSAAPRTVTHRVSRGENLTQIARQYGVSLSDIRRWNNLSRDTIIPGQKLKIEQPRSGARG